MAYSLDGRLGKITARGAKLTGNIAEAVTSASLSLSTSEVSELRLSVLDSPDFELLDSGLFAPGSPRKRGSQLDYAGLHFEVRAVEVSATSENPRIDVTARSIGTGNLKRARGPLVRKKISPTQFAKIEAREAGLKFVGQQSAKRGSIRRQAGDTPETSWDTLQRLASELGYVCFESVGTLYFGKPRWLTERDDRLEYRVKWKGERTDDGLDALPRCRRSGDDAKRLATIELLLRGTAGDDVLPGMVAVLDGVPTFDGAYLIDRVELPLAEGGVATVSASTPINPTPQPAAKPAGLPGTTTETTSVDGGATGAKSAAAFVALALAQAGDSYVYAVEAPVSNADPNAFDCSELVEWASGRVGVPFGGTSTSMAAAVNSVSVEQAIRTRGALLFVHTSSQHHVAISLGNGNTIEAANSRVGVVSYPTAGRGWTSAGLIPGMRY